MKKIAQSKENFEVKTKMKNRKEIIQKMKTDLVADISNRINWPERFSYSLKSKGEVLKLEDLTAEEKRELILAAREYHQEHRVHYLDSVAYFAREILHIEYPELKQDVAKSLTEKMRTRTFRSSWTGFAGYLDGFISFNKLLKSIARDERDSASWLLERMLKEGINEDEIKSVARDSLEKYSQTPVKDFYPYRGNMPFLSEEQRAQIKETELSEFKSVFGKYIESGRTK